jgi:hypothetical protein
MGVASCQSIFILFDVVYNRAFVSFRFSVRDLNVISGKRVRAVGCRPSLGPRPTCGAAHPGSVLARPWRPTPHACPPFSLISLFPCNNFHLPLFHLSPPPLALVGIPLSGCRRVTPQNHILGNLIKFSDKFKLK